MINNVWPAAFVIVPIFLLAQLRRRWSFYFVLFSVPLFHLSLFTVAGKIMNTPEIAMIGLMSHQIYVWLRHRRVALPNKGLLWFLGFLFVALVSIVHIAVDPASGLVNPYGEAFIDYQLMPVTFSSTVLTQFVYRAFTVGSFIVIATTMTQWRALTSLRWIVYSSIGVGIVGVTYQLSRLVQFYALPGAFRWFGFRKFYDTRDSFGPLPRMYSPVGEPGTTSTFLLLGLAVAVTSLLYCDSETIFSRSEAFAATVALALLLLLSTGTTGYGGTIIFFAVLSVVVSLSDWQVKYRAASLAGVGALVTVITAALGFGLGVDMIEMLSYQAQKLMFNAGSGSVRIWYPTHVLPVVLARPLFGVGVGAHYSPLLWSGLLIETGVLGIVTFGLGNLTVYKGILRSVIGQRQGLQQPAAAVFVSGLTLTATLFLARTITVLRYPWYWLIIGIAASYPVWSSSGPTRERAGRSRTDPPDGECEQVDF